jgi:hypothetical protein
MQMRSYLDAKLMAKSLRTSLAGEKIDITHSRALEIVSEQFGLKDWNALSAKIGNGDIRFSETAPIFRIFDEAKAKEFYAGFLGFQWEWEHRFGDNFPLYAQVSRAGLTLHLSGHHGDGSPGASIFVRMSGVTAYREELIKRDYTYMKPGIEDMPWGRVMAVIDPFGNTIRFCESSSTG